MAGPIRYFVVDAFADRPFAGNPAAVVPLAAWPQDNWLKNVAMEMNLSETAFFVPEGGGFRLRWFTPKVEVDLCGHATLASAAVLAHLGELAGGAEVAFATRSGNLVARRNGERFELDFPIKPATECDAPAGLLEALGATPKFVGRSQFDYLLELESESAVRTLSPDFKRLLSVECRGMIVTSRSDDPEIDFVSRFFAPAAGIDEDPVTGSAHCTLADHWSRRFDKKKLVGYQASRRGGIVEVEARGERVLLGGRAVIIAQGELLATP
jgi:PhzF family phenazine biosynthesis protein